MSLFGSTEAGAAAAFQGGYPHVVNVPASAVLDFLGAMFDTFVARLMAGAGAR